MKKLNNYYTPTPVVWRRIGDSLLACSTVIGTYAITVDYKWMGISAVILGVIGKFLSNFFTIKPEDQINPGEISKETPGEDHFNHDSEQISH